MNSLDDVAPLMGRKVDDLSGQKFGRWTVLSRDLETVKRGGRKPNYICQCECGTVRSVPRQAMVKGESKSCGCLHKEIVSANGLKDLVGQKFGRLQVLERDESYKPTREPGSKSGFSAKWLCQCDCGEVTSVSSYPLTAGITVSCGCYQKEAVSKHGGYGDRLYTIWAGILARCCNPDSPAYENYGGRGVVVCEEWRSDINEFKRWALANGYQDDLTTERVDVDGDYCPENVTFIPKSEQSRNRRDTVRLTAWGETKAFHEWIQDPRCKVKKLQTIKARYYRANRNKMTIEQILTTPEMYNEGISWNEKQKRLG